MFERREFLKLSFLALFLTGCGSSKKEKDKKAEEVKEVKKEETYEERHARYIENFINVYNSNYPDQPLTFVEDYDLQNEDSGHYRVEYRLPAYEDSKGAFCTIGDSASMEILGGRVYIEGDEETVFQATLNIIKLFYPNMSDEDYQIIVDEINNPNGYYSQALTRAGVDGTMLRGSAMIKGGIPLDE